MSGLEWTIIRMMVVSFALGCTFAAWWNPATAVDPAAIERLLASDIGECK